MGKWWCRSRSEDREAPEGRPGRVGRQELEGEAAGEMRVGRGGEDWGWRADHSGNSRLGFSLTGASFGAESRVSVSNNDRKLHRF